MILYPKYKKILLHVPRTSGNYIKSLVKCNDEYIILTGRHQHMHINDVRDTFPGWKTYCIYRKPEDIFVSYFYFCKNHQAEYNSLPEDKRNTIYNKDFISHIFWCAPDDNFERFLNNVIERNIICNFGGILETYSDEKTEVLEYGSTLTYRLFEHFSIESYHCRTPKVCVPYTNMLEDRFYKRIRSYCYNDYK